MLKISRSAVTLVVVLNATTLGAAEPPSAPTAGSATAPTLAAVQAIFNHRCISCHGAEKAKASVRLHHPAGIASEVKPGAPDQSSIYSRIILPDDDTGRMPPAKGGKIPRVPDAEVALIRAWIVGGASGLKP